MNIGTFTKQGNDYTGSISTFGASFDQVKFEAIRSAGKVGVVGFCSTPARASS